jgi:hypothetical protein
MVFPLPKWLIKKIDKLRRNFFWKGEEVKGNKGGMCLVKWDIVCRQKELGGLGIHDLSMFGRALCQRWCWYHWTDNDRPWKGMTLSCDEDGMSLFQASTVIRVGDGKTSFLAGQMARRHGTKGHCPEPLQKARFKKRTVTRELPTKNWMHVARYISSREELLEFINLWVLLMNVNLNEEEHDSIGWKWTASGDYSATSAYKIQFQGSHNLFKIGHLWKAKVEPKVKVFGWTTCIKSYLRPTSWQQGVCKRPRFVLSVTPIRKMLTTSSSTTRLVGKSYTIYGLGKILKGIHRRFHQNKGQQHG